MLFPETPRPDDSPSFCDFYLLQLAQGLMVRHCRISGFMSFAMTSDASSVRQVQTYAEREIARP
jgi:hypothetical protein